MPLDKEEENKIVNKAESVAEENERLIVRFTNIDKEDFTHGFRGITITVKAGSSYPCRFPEADHLALHLARKILARAKKSQGSRGMKGTLYTQEEVSELKQKMIENLGEGGAETLTAEEKRKKDLKELDKEYGPEKKETEPTLPPKKKEKIEVTKEDIIRDLKEKGIIADVNKSKEEHLQELIKAESQGK